MTRIIDKIQARRKEHNKSHVRNGAASSEDTPSTASNHSTVSSANSGVVNVTHAPSWYYSFEFFPPKTEPGLENLLTRIDRMCRRLDPLFISITWGANGSTSSRTLSIAGHAQRFACVDVLLHLSCTGLSREKIAHVLNMAKSNGIHNILALRGDPPRGKRAWDVGDVSGGECDRAIDLVRLIRELHGDYFCIGVAGHPEGHPSSPKSDDGREDEMRHLKEKMDAGADFIITQFFYDVNIFMEYVERCRKVGIDAPVVPGIMPIQSYSSLMKMTSFCGISVPSEVQSRLEMIKDDDEAVKKAGCEIATEMCQSILSRSQDLDADVMIDGFHFYTLNLERSTTRILIGLDAADAQVFSRSTSPTFLYPDGEQQQSANNASRRKERGESISEKVTSKRRLLPWKPSTMENRSKEAVRPINWSNRPHSYVMRTDDWDEVSKKFLLLLDLVLCATSYYLNSAQSYAPLQSVSKWKMGRLYQSSLWRPI